MPFHARGTTLTAELPATPNGVRFISIAAVLDHPYGLRAAVPAINNDTGDYMWNMCTCQPAHRDHGEALQCLTNRYKEAQQ
jgi:hypothetical protein